MNHLAAAQSLRSLLADHGLGDAPLEDFVDVMALCREDLLDDGDVLCHESRPGKEMWFLLDGSVAVSKKNYDGTPHHLADLHAPTIIGHMTLIDGAPRSATVTAAGTIKVATLSKPAFDQLVLETGGAGDLMRRLLISSLNEQLGRGNIALQRVIAGEEVELDPETQDIAEHELLRTTASFDGFG
ncbi:MAG: cyclic nucleotide-binding domain-containing protein [Alphaproteobacteria bacterium]|nr:cyclic nucleotide-binding domain-containing protein [Alphaproteobacteria bacterium]